jgi:hypothetical protein
MRMHSLDTYVVAVLIVFALLNAGFRLFASPARAYAVAIFSGGFLLGMLAMWIATKVYR